MDERGWSAGNLRLVPYTRDSLARQEERCRSAEARRGELGIRRERSANLPECESVCIAPDLLPKEVFYTPLEDVGQFGLDKTFCVIAKRSSSYYLYRYSAEDSLFLFSPFSKVRRFSIRLSCHRYFELFVMTTILLNCVFLALSQPIEETEYVFLAIYTTEMIIKTIAKGFVLEKYTYLRNPWNWLDFIVIVAGYITLSLTAIGGVAIGNLSGLRTFRVLRALKTVSITPGLKTIVNAMLHSLGMLVEVMTLTVFCLMVFALLALQLYVGVLHHKCVLDMSSSNESNQSYALHVNNKSMWILDSGGQPIVCGNKSDSRRCPEGYTCLPGIGENPNFGYTNFDSYGWAILTTFQLITLDFWEDVYNKINATTGPTSVFFFMLVVFFGSFYLINLTLAVVAIAYEEEAATTLREQDKIKRIKVSWPTRIYSTLLALKAQTSFIKPTFRRRSQQPQRWCSPRRGAGVPPRSPPVRIQVPRSENTSSTPDMPLRYSRRTFTPGETLYEEDEDEDERSGGSSQCLGEAPDIVISTGGQLPTRGRSAIPRRTVHVFDTMDRRSSDQSCSVIWCRMHFSQCCSSCNRMFQIAFVFLVRLNRYMARLISDPLFDLMITVCILLNTAFLAFEHHGMTARTERILKLGNLVFTIIFMLEAAVKLLVLGRDYFKSNWNIFDLVVVTLSLVDLSFETVGGLSVLRTFRLLRVVKLAQAWPTMRLLLTIIASTLGAVGNMTLVLAVIVYIFAIMGVQLFQDVYSEQNFAPEPVPSTLETVGNMTLVLAVIFYIFAIMSVQLFQDVYSEQNFAPDPLRAVKLAQAWLTMGLLMTIIASTLGAVGNMTLVLAVIVYIFAIMGVQLFQDVYSEQNFAPDPLRAVKLAQAWLTMGLLMTIIASTLGAVGNMTLVLAVIVYIFAIMGVQLFQDVYSEQNFAPHPVPKWNFTDFWHSLLMMFRILCGEWVQPLWDCMRASGDRYYLCIILFLVALTVGNFLVLNLFLAMLLNSFNTQDLQEKSDKGRNDSKLLKSFQRIRTVIRRNNDAQSSSFDSPSQEALFQKRRRWSEPEFKQHLQHPRRASESSISILHGKINESSGMLNSYKLTKNLAAVNKIVSNHLPPVEAFEEEPSNSTSKSSSLKESEFRGSSRIPPNCCPTCICRHFDTQGRPFFRYWSQIRRTILILVDNRVFELVVLILIFCSSIVLCFEDVFLPEKPQLMLILGYFNIFFTACFVLEVLLKWMAYGFIIYFSSLWTTLDFVIVCVSVVSLVAEKSGTGLSALRAFRTLRALRPLRAISRWQGMKIVVNALMSAIPSIFNVLLVCLVFWLIFGIMGVQFFGGQFYRCVDETGRTLPVELTPNVTECLNLNYSWVNRDINFDHVGNAYLALFQVATFEGWTEVMEYASDTTGVGCQPRTEANLPALIYFVVFIICGSFFTLNLFIGVIIDNFNMLKKRYEGGIVEMFLTDSQRAYYTAMLKMGRRKPQKIVRRPTNLYLRLCYDVAISRKFEIFVFFLILLNMIAMTVEHYQQPEEVTYVLEILNMVFTTIFAIEAIVKIIGLRQYFFTFPWNVFDLTVISMSIIGIIFEEALQRLVISPTLLRVIRLFRIGRVLRLIKGAKGIRKLLFALIISLPALFNIGALLFLVTFVYAIIGMSLFGHVKIPTISTGGGGLSEMVNFQTFANSMVLLFRLATSAGWNDVLDTLMLQPPNCDMSYKDLPNGNCGYPTVAVIYLVTYIIINFMVIINMYIAVILENLSQASKEDTGISEDDIEMFYVCWSQFDPKATQFINYDQLSDFIASLDPPFGIEKPNEPALVAMNIPIASGDRIHCLDILHSLVTLVLGNVEDTEEFRIVRKQVDQRFKKTFPTRNMLEIVSTTHKLKQQENAAKVIQRTFKKHRSRLRK